MKNEKLSPTKIRNSIRNMAKQGDLTQEHLDAALHALTDEDQEKLYYTIMTDHRGGFAKGG